MHEIKIYHGIKYATYKRFEKAIPEEFIYDETEESYKNPGKVCPQRNCRLSSIIGRSHLPQIEEGTLYLSIYKRAEKVEEPLPVMVWIHGGAFLTGGSEEPRYDCERLVQTSNIIVVKISYRVGVLGYLYMPEKGVQNLGLEDQRLALQWIKNNIAQFGGDPQNITVFGQSAGAQSIAALIATSNGEALFKRAILQSAPLGVNLKKSEAEKITNKYLEVLGKDPYSATVDEILDAQERVLDMNLKLGMTFMPYVDSYLPDHNISWLESIVIGYNKDDASPFVLPILGKCFDSILGRIVNNAVTKKIFSIPAKRYCETLSNIGIKTKVYNIKWHPKGNALGSCHCIELPFILGNYEDWVKSKMLQGMEMEEYEANSKICLEAWTSYSTDGEFPDINI